METEGEKYKVSTGFVTLGMELTLRYLKEGVVSEEEVEDYVSEGVEATFKYSGSLKQVITQLVGGFRSGMSYCGSMTVDEVHQKAEFIRVSPAGFAEGTPHVLGLTKQISVDHKTLLAK